VVELAALRQLRGQWQQALDAVNAIASKRQLIRFDRFGHDCETPA